MPFVSHFPSSSVFIRLYSSPSIFYSEAHRSSCHNSNASRLQYADFRFQGYAKKSKFQATNLQLIEVARLLPLEGLRVEFPFDRRREAGVGSGFVVS
jgi:hypothetical protein